MSRRDRLAGRRQLRPRHEVAHDLVATNSATAIVVSGNTVAHDLTVKGNSPGGATVSGNSAGHDAVCQSNSPQDGSGNTAVHASSCPA